MKCKVKDLLSWRQVLLVFWIFDRFFLHPRHDLKILRKNWNSKNDDIQHIDQAAAASEAIYHNMISCLGPPHAPSF